jgi:hypothetical protein
MRIHKDTNVNKVSLKVKILSVVIFLWIVISIFDVSYNFVKSFSEAKFWLPLSDSQRRHEVYGSIYDFIVLIGKYTDNQSTILIYSKDNKAYYLARYYLYPRNINVVSNKNVINQILTKTNFDYIALDNCQQNFDKFTPVASSSSRTIIKHL